MNKVLEATEVQSENAKRTVIRQIVARLEEEIVLGRLRPRQRLLEEELAEFFDAKRHVIRAALTELEGMGIIVRQPNRGAAVRDFSSEEVEQIYLVRELLERHAAEIMPLPPAPEVIDELKALHLKHGRAVDDQEPRIVFRANLDFHRVFFAACGNPYLADQIGQLASCAHAIRFHSISDPTLLSQARKEHGQMIECLEQGDREKLTKLVSDHIKPSKEAYLRLAQSVGRNPFA